MYNGAEIENTNDLINSVCVVFKLKGKSLYNSIEEEIENGNIVIVYPNGSMLKSKEIGLQYFKNNFERVY